MEKKPYRHRRGKHQQCSGHWLPRWRRIALYLRDSFTCQYCGKDLHSAEWRNITLDHLIPQSQGGTHDNDNLITACLSCNSSRQDKDWRDYATGGAIRRINGKIRRNMTRYIKLAKALLSSPDPDFREQIRNITSK